ncbi:hypothetical protein ACOMHN_064502 [Nucella lapillus]
MELGILHNSPPSTKRGCRAGRLHRLWHGLPPAPWPCTRSQHHSVPSRNLHPLMVPPFLQPHPDLQSAVGNAPLSSKHPAQLPTTDCLLSIISPIGGQPSDAPALSPPSPLQQGGQSSNAPALSPPSPLPQGGQPIALALSPPSPPPQGGQPSDAPGLSLSSSTLLLCPSDSTLNICHLNSQSAVKTGLMVWLLLMCAAAVPSVFSVDCPMGTFGTNCQGTCHCLDNELCAPDNGECTAGKCEKGYYPPPFCQDECPDGKFGIDCDETCHCMNDSPCNKRSGACPGDLCHPDWYSAACRMRLPKLVNPPTVSVATCPNLTVTWPVWNADTDFGDLQLPVAEYRLYMRLNSSASMAWQQVAKLSPNQNTSRTHFSFKVTGLLPDQYYFFRVDVHGSNDGKVVEKVSPGAVSDLVQVPCTRTEIFNAMASSKEGETALRITWSLDPNLRRFSWNITLSYQRISIGDCSPLSKEPIVTVPVSQTDTEYRLTGLQSWSQYRLTLTAQGTGVVANANGTEVVTATTGEVRPSGRVGSLKTTDLQATGVTLTWGELPCAERGGVLLHYDIIVASPDLKVMVQHLRSNRTSVAVMGLAPFTNFTAMVRYVNRAEGANYSEELPFTTAEGAPAAVEISSLVPTVTTVVVYFDRPKPANGILLEFYVLYSTSSAFTNPASLSVDAFSSDPPVIKRLTPDTVYYVKVRARTSAGDGDYGTPVTTQTLHILPFPPSSLVQTVVNSSCVSVSWLPPDQASVSVTEYNVTVKRVSDGTTDSILLPAEATNYTRCGLDPSTAYTVSVLSRSQGVLGDPASVQIMTQQQTPPKPPAPTLVSVTPTTAQLQIRPVSVRPGPVVFYQLEVERMSGEGGRRRKRLAAVPGYVTAQLSPDAVVKNNVFVVGDGRDYGGFTNLRLDSGQRYQVYYVLVSQWNGVTKFSVSQLPSPFTTSLPTTTTTTTTTVVTNATTTEEVPSPEDDNGAFIGVIIALVLVLLLIVVLIIVILWWRRRQRAAQKNVYVELDEERKIKPLAAEVYDPEKYWNQVSSLRESRFIVVGRECLPAEQLVPASGGEHPLSDAPIVTFQKEFQSLPHTLEQAPTQEALNHPERNRFPHILPYDHSRVELTPDASSPCPYVNANFLSGYRGPRAYIAAQSPYNDDTAVDFWRLIHQQGVKVVAMLAGVVENNIVKCTQFWPQKGKVTIGQFFLEMQEEMVYADFTLYDISMRESGEECERTVRLFDFTAWPEHGVPDDPLPFLDFRRKVRGYQGEDSSPILVHCGTGVARSGIFIAVDSLIDQYAVEGRISVVSFVRKMRSERPLMVRTYKQYAFIYECLLEHFHAGVVLATVDSLKDMYHRWTNTNNRTDNSFLRDQFHLLQRLTRGLDGEQCSAAFLPHNVPKNRHPYIVPQDQHTPTLLPTPSCPEGQTGGVGGDYINAIFVDGYRTQNQFIVTQTPLHNTLSDFWRLVHQHRVRTIVTMDNYNQLDAAAVHYWSPDLTAQPCGPFVVRVTAACQEENITIRELRLVNTNQPEEEPHLVTQFQFNGWAEKIHTPVSKTMALDLLDRVREFQQACSNPHSPIVVHCEDGATHSGLFVCLAVLCEKMEEEQEVDVYHAIKHIKRRRPHIMQDYDQYRFCYKALWDFLNLRMPGGPFTDTLGQTKGDKVYGVASLSLTSHSDNLY